MSIETARFRIQRAVAFPLFVAILALAAKCGGDASAATPAGASASSGPTVAAGAATDPKKFCATLLPEIQKLVKIPLTVLSSDDATTDQMHTGEAGYLSCVNGNGEYRASIIMSEDKSFTSAPQHGYEPLAGYGDIARSAKSAYDWVDVMKGKHFCEAIVTIRPEDLVDPDWKQTGGKMCNAAYALR